MIGEEEWETLKNVSEQRRKEGAKNKMTVEWTGARTNCRYNDRNEKKKGRDGGSKENKLCFPVKEAPVCRPQASSQIF